MKKLEFIVHHRYVIEIDNKNEIVKQTNEDDLIADLVTSNFSDDLEVIKTEGVKLQSWHIDGIFVRSLSERVPNSVSED